MSINYKEEFEELLKTVWGTLGPNYFKYDKPKWNPDGEVGGKVENSYRRQNE